MWRVLPHHVAYEPQEKNIQVPVILPDWSLFSGDIRRLDCYSGEYIGYDDWVSHFPRPEEMSLVQEAIKDAKKNIQRIHIRGISTIESIELIRDYYRDRGYEDDLAKSYTLPENEPLTVSIGLRHALWCEKDKDFLKTLDSKKNPYGKTLPPLRSPRDLRVLQQALRMGIIMGIELEQGDVNFIYQLLTKQILSPFHIGQMTNFRWIKHGFVGSEHACHLELPHFSAETSEF